MKGKIRRMISLVLTAGCIICLTRAFLYNSIPKDRRQISILQLKTACDEKTAKAYSADIPFTFWGEQQETEIRNKDLGRSTKASVIAVCGDSSLVLEGSQILDSSMSGYCLMDKKTSQELFGSTSAAGQMVEIGKTVYRVAGSLNSPKPAILIQTDDKQEIPMDKVSLRIPETENRQEQIRLFSTQTGIEGTEISVEYYRIWGNLMTYVLPVFLFGTVLYELIKLIHAYRNMPVLYMVLLLLFLSVLAVSVWILDIHGGFPVEMLPSKWSDFDFWSNLWEQKVQEMEFLVQVEKSQPQLILFYRFLKAVGCSVVAVLLAYVSLPEVEKIKGRKRAAVMFGSLLVTFLAILGFTGGNPKAAENRAVWLFFPAWLMGRYIIQKLKERLGNS